MALASSVVWEVQSGGSDNNGGGYAGNSALAAPAAPSLSTSASGGTVAANTYYCVVAYKDDNGVEGPKSSQSSVTTTGATSTITVTSPAASAGASAWAVYFSTTSGGPYFQQGTGLTIGSNRVVTSTPPTSGTQPFGTDYSQQATQQVNIDNSAITTSITTTTITFTGYTPTAADVGNLVQFLSGTNITAGSIFQIVGWTSTTWVVDRNIPSSGTTTNATAKMGGCLASPGMAFSAAVGLNTVYVKQATYTMSTTNNASGGRVTLPAGTVPNPTRLIGYNATRDDLGTRPIFQPSSNSTTLVTCSNGDWEVVNVEFQKNATTGCTALSAAGARGRARHLKCDGPQTAISISGDAVAVEHCEVTNATTAAFSATTGFGIRFQNCYAHGNTAATADFNFNNAQAGVCSGCVSSGSGVRGFSTSTNTRNAFFKDCVAYAPSGHGFDITGSGSAESCLAVGSTSGYGFANDGSTARKEIARLYNCGGYNNFSGDYDTHLTVTGFIAASADPFANAAGNDFRLNAAASGGALLRGAGWPQSFPGLGSATNHPDVGAYKYSTVDAAAAPPNYGIRTGGRV